MPVDPDWGPSAHLTWRELACHDDACTAYPAEWRDNRALVLAAVFEALRRACGARPLRVLSGYRTPHHNRAVGGTRRSQHVEGRAIDVAPPVGTTAQLFHAHVRDLARTDLRVGGVGYYGWGVHIDTRPRRQGRLVAWSCVRRNTRLHEAARA